MATSLIATPLPDQAAVRLYLESSAEAPIVMVDFSSSVPQRDAELALWSVSGTGMSKSVSSSPRQVVVLRADVSTATTSYATRPVSGLTVGQRYRVSVAGAIFNSNTTWLFGINGIGSKTVYPSFYPSGSSEYTLDGVFVYEFVATATTHDLRVSPATVPTAATTFSLSGLRVEKIPSALIKLETDFPSSEDANWTYSGVPTGAVGSKNSTTQGANRALNLTVGRSTGFPVLTTSTRAQRTITGLTIGRQYIIRLLVSVDAEIGGASVPIRSTLGIVGVGATDAAVWSSTPQWASYTFTATATSHAIAISVGETVYFQENSFIDWQVDYLGVDEAVSVASRTLNSLIRSDSNGTTSVRLFEDQDLSAGVLIVSDYEVALVGNVVYTAIVNSGGGTEIASASVVDLGVDRPIIAPATMPQFGETVSLITGYMSQRDARTTIHDVVGRADPLVTLGPLRTRRGTLEMFSIDYANARALQGVYDRGEVVLLRQPDFPGMDMYHVATSVHVDPDERRWRVTVDYVEVAIPTGPLLGSLGWTFDQAATSYATFAAARGAFPTFNEYTLGPVG